MCRLASSSAFGSTVNFALLGPSFAGTGWVLQCLSELGLQPQIKHIDDFDWESTEGHLLILPHLSAMTRGQAEKVAAFSKKKNTVLTTGLTGFYDEKGYVWPLGAFPFVRELKPLQKERGSTAITKRSGV